MLLPVTNVARGFAFLSGHPSSTLLWIAPPMNESAAKTIDRRPIATRNRKWAQSATTWLAAQNVSTNTISIAGMCACLAGGLANLVARRSDWRATAANGKHPRRNGRARIRSRFKSRGALQRGSRSRFGCGGVHRRRLRLGRKRCRWLYRCDSGNLHSLCSRRRKNRRRA